MGDTGPLMSIASAKEFDGQADTESATITEPLKRHRPPTERPTGDVKSS